MITAHPHYVTPLRLKDGTVVPTRPILPRDAQALQRFHRRLSERSIFLRHFGTVPELSDKSAHYFTNVDGVSRVALVALNPEEPDEIIAVVRYDLEPGTQIAEYAALVEDRWQRRGIGLGLTRRLVNEARQRGVSRLYAMVMPGNAPMLRLLTALDLPEQVRRIDGIERVEVDLQFPEPPDNQPVDSPN